MNEKINLLVTGGCGFIGSNLLIIFLQKQIQYYKHRYIYYCANENNVNKEIKIQKIIL